MSLLSKAPRDPPDLKPYFLTCDDLPTVIDWAKLFGNVHPVEIDVGSGRGLFLVTAATENPKINYLGLELDFKEGRRAARRLKKRTLLNARIMGGDARVVLDRMIPAASVSVVHVYFPDPWWKRRHKKRRLVTDEFVEQMARILKPGGIVQCWTDVEDYFDIIRALMDHHDKFVTGAPEPLQAPRHDMDYRTSFERKKRKAGLSVCRGKWQRLGEP